LELPNRELFAPISELKLRGLIEEFFAERLPQQDAAALLRSKAEHLVLAGPFGWQVGETGNSHAMREPPVDGGLDGEDRFDSDCIPPPRKKSTQGLSYLNLKLCTSRAVMRRA
jgi:hypothetical protein